MPENNEDSPKEHKFEGKLPDEIYVDNSHRYEKRKAFDGKMEYFESIQKIEKGRYPLFLRLLTMIGGMIILFGSLFLTVFTLFVTCLAAVCLFSSEPLNQNMKSLWKMLRRIWVFSLSLFIATFFPAFGFGILALYLMMNGENPETSFMSRLLKTRLNF